MSENTAPRAISLLTVGVLLVALAGAFLIGLRLNQDPDPSARGVVTSGEGTVTATPDQLRFTATVTNRGATTAAAMAKTNKGVKAVIAAVKAAGVEDKDIQTTNLSVEPRYNYSKDEEKIVGYSSSQELQILVRKLADGGSVIGKAAGAAADTVSVQSVALTIGEKGDLIAQARTKAVEESKKAAVALAKAAGKDVDDLVYVEEVAQNDDGNQPYPMDAGLAAGSADRASEIPIAPGEQKIVVNVKVRWSMS